MNYREERLLIGAKYEEKAIIALQSTFNQKFYPASPYDNKMCGYDLISEDGQIKIDVKYHCGTFLLEHTPLYVKNVSIKNPLLKTSQSTHIFRLHGTGKDDKRIITYPAQIRTVENDIKEKFTISRQELMEIMEELKRMSLLDKFTMKRFYQKISDELSPYLQNDVGLYRVTQKDFNSVIVTLIPPYITFSNNIGFEPKKINQWD